jgi:hypothetical protein
MASRSDQRSIPIHRKPEGTARPPYTTEGVERRAQKILESTYEQLNSFNNDHSIPNPLSTDTKNDTYCQRFIDATEEPHLGVEIMSIVAHTQAISDCMSSDNNAVWDTVCEKIIENLSSLRCLAIMRNVRYRTNFMNSEEHSSDFRFRSHPQSRMNRLLKRHPHEYYRNEDGELQECILAATKDRHIQVDDCIYDKEEFGDESDRPKYWSNKWD